MLNFVNFKWKQIKIGPSLDQCTNCKVKWLTLTRISGLDLRQLWLLHSILPSFAPGHSWLQSSTISLCPCMHFRVTFCSPPSHDFEQSPSVVQSVHLARTIQINLTCFQSRNSRQSMVLQFWVSWSSPEQTLESVTQPWPLRHSLFLSRLPVPQDSLQVDQATHFVQVAKELMVKLLNS